MSNNDKRPLILISNDDGHDFAGIKTLTAVARELGDVVVVAPQQHQSGKSSAITVMEPLRAFLTHDEPGFKHWIVTGTPTDCVKLALDQLLDGREPDLVLSGINHGFNTGVSTIYSGTMGACFEGCIHHVPSVALSYGEYGIDVDMSPCIPVARQVIYPRARARSAQRRVPQREHTQHSRRTPQGHQGHTRKHGTLGRGI